MAEPSRANWDEGQPRVCSGCGGKLRITKDRIWFERQPEPRSWHWECRDDWQRLRGRPPVDETTKRKEQEEWQHKRELENTQRRTGLDPILLEWPP